MARTFKLAIARIKEPGFEPTPELEAAIQAVVVANRRTGVHPGGDAVLQFWEQVTDGQLTFEPTLLPWATVAVSKDDASGKPPGVGRAVLLAKSMAALAGLPQPPDLAAFDGLAILVFPGIGVSVPDPAQPGASVLAPYDGGGVGNVIRTAMLPVGVPSHTHSFLAHELGHVLGLPDSQGIWSWTPTPTPEDPGAGYWSGGYGDPLEIMSAQGWPGGDPTLVGAPYPDWPNAQLHTRMGPAPSLALLHWVDGQMLDPQAVHEFVVPDGAAPRVRLNAAHGAFPVKRLLVVHPEAGGQARNPQGLGRLYLELRVRRLWDAGIDDPGDVLARTGVVAHAVVPLAGQAPHVAYRGQIPVPLDEDSDLRVGGTPFTVRVTHDRSANGWVMVQVSRGGPEHFDVDAEVVAAGARGVGLPQMRRTPCGDLLRWGIWETQTVGRYVPHSWGFGGEGGLLFGDAPRPSPQDPVRPPAVEIRWTVGGVAVPPGGGILAGCVADSGVTTVDCGVDALSQTLTLTTAFGQAVGGLTVRAELVDHVGARSLVRHRRFDAQGSYVGYPRADIAKLARCGARLASELRLKPDVFRLPNFGGPRPNWSGWDRWLARFDEELARLPAGSLGPRSAMKQFRDVVGTLRPGPAAPNG